MVEKAQKSENSPKVGDGVEIRFAEVADVPFFYNSWLKSFRDAATVRNIPHDLYYAGQHSVIERILARPGVRVLVACNKADPDQIFGYLVAEQRGTDLYLHWCYVKQSFRGLGIANSLLGAIMQLAEDLSRRVPAFYTHRLRNSVDNKIREAGMIYNPYVLTEL